MSTNEARDAGFSCKECNEGETDLKAKGPSYYSKECLQGIAKMNNPE